MNCPNCGDQARDEYANYCSTCGNRLKLEKKRSRYQISAGILMIIAASLAATVGLISLMPFMFSFRSFFSSYASIFMSGVMNLLGFFFGLASGIFILKRKRFTLSIIGEGLILVSSFMAILFLVMLGPIGVLFGMHLLIFSVLALIFTAVSRREFI